MKKINKTNDTIEINNNKKSEKQMLKSVLCVVVGTLIYDFGIGWILLQSGFFSGGVTGLAQLFVSILDKFANVEKIKDYLGYFILFINIPLLVIGWKRISKRFAILTLISILIQTIFLRLLARFTISPFALVLSNATTNPLAAGEGIIDVVRLALNGDFNFIITSPAEYTRLKAIEAAFFTTMSPGTKLLLAIVGGLITGYGVALCLKGGGSSGGIDIIANIFFVNNKISFSKMNFLIDACTVIASSLISIEKVLYTIIRLIIYVKVIDSVYYAYKSTRIEIITDKAEELKKVLFANIMHSMTIYDATGGYSGKQKKVIEIYASSFETNEYIHLIRSIDPAAFIVTSKVKKIDGNYIQRRVI